MSKKILIGYTGLIGSTLSEKIKFDYIFNSENIEQYVRIVPNDCDIYLSCLPASKWIVNQNLDEDINNINKLIDILKNKKYNNIFLFSTIDIYNDSPLGSNEDYHPNIGKLNYGNNRYIFELFISQFLIYNSLKIFRLPAIFSKRIKKNILFDLINNNNIDKINTNSKYQWYNLSEIHNDIQFFSQNYPNEKIFNLFPEPIETIDIVSLFPQHKSTVIFNQNETVYDYTTKFGGYIFTKEKIFADIKRFVNEFSIK